MGQMPASVSTTVSRTPIARTATRTQAASHPPAAPGAEGEGAQRPIAETAATLATDRTIQSV